MSVAFYHSNGRVTRVDTHPRTSEACAAGAVLYTEAVAEIEVPQPSQGPPKRMPKYMALREHYGHDLIHPMADLSVSPDEPAWRLRVAGGHVEVDPEATEPEPEPVVEQSGVSVEDWAKVVSENSKDPTILAINAALPDPAPVPVVAPVEAMER